MPGENQEEEHRTPKDHQESNFPQGFQEINPLLPKDLEDIGGEEEFQMIPLIQAIRFWILRNYKKTTISRYDIRLAGEIFKGLEMTEYDPRYSKAFSVLLSYFGQIAQVANGRLFRKNKHLGPTEKLSRDVHKLFPQPENKLDVIDQCAKHLFSVLDGMSLSLSEPNDTNAHSVDQASTQHRFSRRSLDYLVSTKRAKRNTHL